MGLLIPEAGVLAAILTGNTFMFDENVIPYFTFIIEFFQNF